MCNGLCHLLLSQSTLCSLLSNYLKAPILLVGQTAHPARPPRRRTPRRKSTTWQSATNCTTSTTPNSATTIRRGRSARRTSNQRCRLDQVLETARARRDQWLQSAPDQRANLEPAYILGDRKLIPEARGCAADRIVRCDTQDHCRFMHAPWLTAELITWHIMKQLILLPDVSEVTCTSIAS